MEKRTRGRGPLKLNPKQKRALMFNTFLPYIFGFFILVIIAGLLLFYSQNPIRTEQGFVFLEERIHYTHNQLVFVSQSSGSFFERALFPLGLEDFHFVRIVAGPYGRIDFRINNHVIDTESGLITLGELNQRREEIFLENQYLVKDSNSNFSIISASQVRGLPAQ